MNYFSWRFPKLFKFMPKAIADMFALPILMLDADVNPNDVTQIGGDYFLNSSLNDLKAIGATSNAMAAEIIKAEGKSERGYYSSHGTGINADMVSNWKATEDKETARAESKQDMEDLFKLSAEYGRQQVLQAEESATRMIERNIERFPEISELSLTETREAATGINEFMRGEYEAALDDLYPEWREDIIGAGVTAQRDAIAVTERFRSQVLPKVMDAADELSMQMLGQASSMLSGELPDDVAAQLRRHAAEVSQQIGVRGQAAQYLTARDLGRTSLDMIQAGMAAAPAALNLAPAAYGSFTQALQMPVMTGQQVTNLMAPYRAPIADASALYGGSLNILSGAGMISGNTALSTAAQVGTSAGGMIQNQLQFGREYQSQQYWNSINYSAQQRAAAAAASGGGGGVLGGAMAGASAGAAFGPWGAAIGGVGGALLSL